MIFSSIPFLYCFLPAVILLYFAVPGRGKNVVLLLASLVFYAWGELRYTLLMLVMITQGYVFGRLIDSKRRWSKVFLATSVVISLGVLGYFKYAGFFLESFGAVTGLAVPVLKVTLPIGISFYTFQVISYVIDVYRKTVAAQRSYIDMAMYISMFPQLIAGPIVRYSDIEGELHVRKHSTEKTACGIRRFIIGLSKKVLIANQLGELIDAYTGAAQPSVLFVWLYAIACTLQIYFDFSGYSDMAIGLGKIFGFDFPENFNYPYISKSITEFWRRWHMSLGTWFRDYVYIPMGGNRVKKWRWFLNILVVWALTGLWHGAAWNFVIWGLYMAFFLILEKLFLLPLLKKSRAAGHIYTMLLVMISFVIFSAATMSDAGAVIAGMFGAGGLSAVSAESLYYLKSYAITLIIAIAGSLPVVRNVFAGLEGRMKDNKVVNAVFTIGEPVVLAALLILVTGYLVDGSFNPFLYFRF